jgi:hypothetical protein
MFTRGDQSYNETKTGSFVYHGDAANFHEWEFRTRLRSHGKRGDQYVDIASKVVDGLRGEAFVVAQEIGLDVIWTAGVLGRDPTLEDEGIVAVPSGIEQLVTAMRERVFPYTTHEAKELFRQYIKQSGALARQSGESISKYISRRQRCWKLLRELDPTLELSDGHRSDMLLDLAGLDKQEKIMVQASIGNVRDFDRVAEALILQPSSPHEREQIDISQRTWRERLFFQIQR